MSRRKHHLMGLTLEVTPEMQQVLADLSEACGLPLNQTFRLAIALLKTVKQAETRGERPALIDSAGNVTAHLVGLGEATAAATPAHPETRTSSPGRDGSQVSVLPTSRPG